VTRSLPAPLLAESGTNRAALRERQIREGFRVHHPGRWWPGRVRAARRGREVAPGRAAPWARPVPTCWRTFVHLGLRLMVGVESFGGCPEAVVLKVGHASLVGDLSRVWGCDAQLIPADTTIADLHAVLRPARDGPGCLRADRSADRPRPATPAGARRRWCGPNTGRAVGGRGVAAADPRRPGRRSWPRGAGRRSAAPAGTRPVPRGAPPPEVGTRSGGVRAASCCC
jgi:hypothetical protein